MKSQIEKDLTAKMATEFATNEQDLKNQLAERDLQIKAARAEELELRKSKRELEERQATLDLEIQRKLDLERVQIAEEAMKAANAKSDLIVQQQAHRIQEMQKAIDESARKAMQGSQQSQGEALELKLEAELALLYPDDTFEPVQKGMRGADLIQRVRAASGRVAGTIIWEFKQTKAWSDDWIHKLKDDQRELSAELAAIISNVIPNEVNQMGTYDGVWVTKPGLAKAMAHTMREQILHVHQAHVTNQIPSDQKEMVFKYLTGTKFRQSIDGEIQTVNDLLAGLAKEKRSFMKAWATREQMYNQLIGFKAGLYGDLQGILGKSLPNIANLELDLPSEEI
ncbi:MAG: DUF2130 domain-containing protein [Proteobacteria bacterium]|nr:MAG: DUF2130 domain-containing protein [Pseudomonadota bacterium]